MNLTIELSDEKAAALKAQAAALGLTVERWIEQLAERAFAIDRLAMRDRLVECRHYAARGRHRRARLRD